MKNKKVVIIGAGPAGLTAAYELLEKTNYQVVILEQTNQIGGISKTENYNGYKMDMGGHRFFSKSARVMDWWMNVLPLQGHPSKDDLQLERVKEYSPDQSAPDPEKTDLVMLVRERRSRIFFQRNFINYPLTINFATLRILGLVRIVKIFFSYMHAKLFQIKDEQSLEDFMVNRFGRELYSIFFRDYTHKVWGVPPDKIDPDWGAQRIKGLSIAKVVLHALSKLFIRKTSTIDQSSTETSLIERFLYPKLGPGQLWEEVARRIVEKGGEIHFHERVTALSKERDTITKVITVNSESGTQSTFDGDYFISTMPVRELIPAIQEKKTDDINAIAEGLVYRDFITVGLLLNKFKVKNDTETKTINDLVPDSWIYIQEKDVKIGRLQVFNNWSPYLLQDQNKVWLGLEYFCTEGDDLWNMDNEKFINFAINELVKLDMIDHSDIVDSTMFRVPKAYPAYFGSYKRFDELKHYLNAINNLCLIGRNGMHHYNNMDHSMLSAFEAVNNIVNQVPTKENIWNINSKEEYHEIKDNN